MSKRLFLCEKLNQAKDYAKALGINNANTSAGYFQSSDSNTYVSWAWGHLFELLKPKEYPEFAARPPGLGALPFIPKEYKFKVKEDDKAKSQFKAIKGVLKIVNEVIISTDPDREGELIGRIILQEAGYTGKIGRILTASLDDKSLKKAIQNIEPADEKSKHYLTFLAGLARMHCDWTFGYNGSIGMTNANRGKVDGTLPVGRVMTPTLNIIYLNDKAIENFKPKTYFNVESFFEYDEKLIKTQWQIPKNLLEQPEEKYLVDKKIAEELVKKVLGKQGTVTSCKKTRKKESAPLGYSLSLLQKDAEMKFGIPIEETMKIAQSLYDKHKATTYPRTDSQHLPSLQKGEIQEVLTAIKDTDPSNKDLDGILTKCDPKFVSNIWNDKEVQKSAHHCIIPTITASNVSAMSDNEKKVYDLIRKRYLAQFLPLFEYDSTTLDIECEGETFRATGKVPIIQGWKIVQGNYKEEEESDEEGNATLPMITEGEALLNKDSKLRESKTKPPAKFKASTLLEAMKKADKFIDDPELKRKLVDTEGLGTEATRTNIVNKLLDNNYLAKDGQFLKSTDKGRMLIECVPSVLKDIALTAFWETQLSKIERGEVKLDFFLSEQEKIINEIVSDLKAGKGTFGDSVGFAYKCPKCGSGLRRMKSKKDPKKFFWMCLDFDNCKTFLPDNRGKPGEAFAQAKEIDQGTVEHNCLACKSKLVKKEGKFGLYWNCSNKECNKNYKDKDGSPILQVAAPVTSDYTCPTCKKGKLVERKGPKGAFWGCNRFRDGCKTAIKDNGGKPEGF